MVSAYSLTQLLCNIFSLLHNDLYAFMYSYVDASCEVHEEVADRLKGDTRIWVGHYTSEYG